MSNNQKDSGEPQTRTNDVKSNAVNDAATTRGNDNLMAENSAVTTSGTPRDHVTTDRDEVSSNNRIPTIGDATGTDFVYPVSPKYLKSEVINHPVDWAAWYPFPPEFVRYIIQIEQMREWFDEYAEVRSDWAEDFIGHIIDVGKAVNQTVEAITHLAAFEVKASYSWKQDKSETIEAHNHKTTE